MELGLSGKTAIISGGSRGIGLACARALAAEGVRVGLIARSQENLDAACKTLPGAVAAAADLTDDAAAAAAVERLEALLGPIDILVNSAGGAKRTQPDDLSPAAWRAAMDAKYFSYVNVITPVIKRMAARGHGVVINIIGAGGKFADPTHLAGGAANAALMLVTSGLNAAFAAKGVRVLGINPSITRSERVAEILRARSKLENITEAEALSRTVQRIPMGRITEPEEIANVVTFFASERASYVGGSVLGMDGGAHPTVV